MGVSLAYLLLKYLTYQATKEIGKNLKKWRLWTHR